MDGTIRDNIQLGAEVMIITKQDQETGELTQGKTKQDQETGELTQGKVADILTNSTHHPRGIKVRLVTGEVGRVQE